MRNLFYIPYPRSFTERGQFLLYVEFENLFCPAKPSRNIAIKPLHNLWDICRSQISDVAVNISICHSLTDGNHGICVIADSSIFTDCKRTR